VKTFAMYAAACAAIVALLAGVASLFTDEAGRQAVFASACLALGIQLLAFMVARLLQPRHFALGWGVGSLMRLVALLLYAAVVARLWRAPMAPALLSFVAFLFVMTVVEPLFLKRP
jgi:hypothetical protein